MNVYAGYDRANWTKVPIDALITSGLHNCMAVAGFNSVSGLRILAHYDTLNCIYKGVINTSELQAFKIWITNKINATQFVIRLGDVWEGNPGGVSPQAMAVALNTIFQTNVDSGTYATTCIYDSTGIHSSNATPDSWTPHSSDGEEIPYKKYPTGIIGTDCIIS